MPLYWQLLSSTRFSTGTEIGYPRFASHAGLTSARRAVGRLVLQLGSTVAPPERIEGVGDPNQPVKLAPGFDLATAVLSAQDGYVLSRVDGQTTVATLCIATGLGEAPTLEILRRLRSQGVIVVGDEAPVKVNTAPGSSGAGESAEGALDDGSSEASAEDVELLAYLDAEEGVDLSVKKRRRIIEVHGRLNDMNFFELLDVSLEADDKAIKRAYFKRSKEFHPDRYYTKKLGRYKEMLEGIFRQMSAARDFLEDPKQRSEYAQMIRNEHEEEALREQLAEEAAAELASIVEGFEGSAGAGVAPEEASSPPTPRASRARAPRFNRRQHIARQLAGRFGTPVPGTPAVSQPTSEPVVREDDPARQARRVADRARRRRSQVGRVVGAAPQARKAAKFFEQGKRQFEEGKFLAAAGSLKLALSLDERNAQYKELYERASSMSRDQTADGYFKRAVFEESVGRFEVAGNLYVRAANVYPKGAYLRKAAEATLRTEDLIKAKEYATKAVRDEPKSVEARMILARVYLAGGMKRNARREAEEALKISPNSPEAKALLKEIKRS